MVQGLVFGLHWRTAAGIYPTLLVTVATKEVPIAAHQCFKLTPGLELVRLAAREMNS